MILIIGAQGSMGTRYKAILNDLGVSYIGIDKEVSLPEITNMAKNFKGIILATPTHTHYAIIKSLIPLCVPILCEKPVTKNIEELEDILMSAYKANCPFDMVYQYKYLVDDNSYGPTCYSYFRHGNDGLIWDCMQIIGLSRGPVNLFEKSPIWNCAINGVYLNLSDMDGAYVKQVKDWLISPRGNFPKIKQMHLKTAEYEKQHG